MASIGDSLGPVNLAARPAGPSGRSGLSDTMRARLEQMALIEERARAGQTDLTAAREQFRRDLDALASAQVSDVVKTRGQHAAAVDRAASPVTPPGAAPDLPAPDARRLSLSEQDPLTSAASTAAEALALRGRLSRASDGGRS